MLLIFMVIIFFLACEEENANNDYNYTSSYSCIDNNCVVEHGGEYATLDDCLSVCSINSRYTGNWNFKGNGVSYSGYYTYDSLLNSEWVSNVTMTTNYNDSTGSIQLGANINELIFKYCESCEPIIYNLNDSGFFWSESLGGNTGWSLTDTTFYSIITPAPPSYSTSYSTYDIEGWKL